MTRILTLLAVIMGASLAETAETIIRLPEDGAVQGYTMPLQITLDSVAPITGVQFDLKYDATRLVIEKPILDPAQTNHSLDFAELDIKKPGTMRIVVHSSTNAVLVNGPICWLPITAQTNAPNGAMLLTGVGPVSGTAEAQDVSTKIFSGKFMVGNAIAMTRNGVRIQFESLSETNFISQSVDLIQWSTVSTNLAGTNGIFFIVEKPSQSQRFYKGHANE